MKTQKDEQTQRLLILIKLDANNLFDRIKERKNDYLEIFALRRTREHFPQIFKNRYQDLPLLELKKCNEDLITLLDHFYKIVDDMSWYLYATEDMPGTVEMFVDRKIIQLEKHILNLNFYLNVELGVEDSVMIANQEVLKEDSSQ